MKDTSLLSEIKSARKARKARVKYYIGIGVIASVLVITGVASALHNDKVNDSNTAAVSSSDFGQSQPSSKETSQQDAKPVTNPKPKASTANTSSGAQNVDINAVNAKLCKSVMENVKALGAQYNKMYFDAQKEWNDNYIGNYDSPEAKESRDWYVNHIKNLYKELISSNGATYNKTCGNGGSINDIVYQPNYASWQ